MILSEILVLLFPLLLRYNIMARTIVDVIMALTHPTSMNVGAARACFQTFKIVNGSDV
jgi:hypothetical protein